MNFHPLLHCEFPAENWIGGKKFYLIFRAFGLLIKIQRVKKKRTMKNHRHIQNRSRTRSRENKNPSPRATAEVKKNQTPYLNLAFHLLRPNPFPKKKLHLRSIPQYNSHIKYIRAVAVGYLLAVARIHLENEARSPRVFCAARGTFKCARVRLILYSLAYTSPA